MLAKIWSKIRTRKISTTIMIVGLDNSGKTSVLECIMNLDGIRLNQASTTTPNLESTTDFEQALEKSVNSAQDAFKTRMKPNKSSRVKSTPTVGFNHENIQYKQMAITMIDFSGQIRYRNLWQEFYNSIDGIVFVIDSSDSMRFVVVRDELEMMLSHPFFNTLDDSCTIEQCPSLAQKQLVVNRGRIILSPLESSSENNNRSRRRFQIPILFLCHKADSPNSVDTKIISEALKLNEICASRHPWRVQSTSARSNQGIAEGFEWLASQLSHNRAQ